MSTGYEIVKQEVDVPAESANRWFDYVLVAPDGKRVVHYEAFQHHTIDWGAGPVSSWAKSSSGQHLSEDRSGCVFPLNANGPEMSWDPDTGVNTPIGPGATNQYRLVIACIDADSAEVTGLPAPAAFRAQVNTDRKVQLAWEPVPGAAGYRIYEAANSPGGVATVQGTSSLRGPLEPWSYEYFVRALDSDGTESADSVHAVVTVGQS